MPRAVAILTSVPLRVLMVLAVVLAFGASILVAPGLGATPAIFVDGFAQDPVTGVVEENYAVNGITYTQDQATGTFAGILYTAEDEERFYFAFAQSPLINDNTYGTNQIGWPSKRPHRLSDLLLSDNARVQLYDASGALVYDFRIDYASQNKDTGVISSLGVTGGDGSILVGSPGDITAASSLEWNFNDATPTYANKLNTNPRRVPTNSYSTGTTADPASPWIYETVYEWSVSKARFSGGVLGNIKILEVHNSPTKSINPVPVPIVRVKKEANPPSGSSVQVGQTITYTVTATNVGTTALSNVTITDKVDANLNSVVPMDGGTYSSSTKTVTWQAGTLAPGQTATVRFTAVVLSTAAEGAKIYNTATINSSSLSTPARTNTTVHTVVASPAISLVKTASPTSITSPVPGSLVKYSYTVKNSGNTTLTNVKVTDDKIAGSITLGASTLAPGASTTGTANYAVTQADIDAGSVINTALATGTPPAGPNVTAAATATVTLGRNPAISLTKTPSASSIANPAAGDPISYTFAVKNTGNVTLTNVNISDPLISGPIVLSSTTLAPGATATGSGSHVLTQTEIDAGSVTNTATATGTAPVGTTPATVSATASATVTLTRKPAISLVKTADPVAIANPVPGAAITYTFTVTNTGNTTLSSVNLTDSKITGPITLATTTLAPGASTTGTATYAVTQADINAGQVANTATAKGTAPAGTSPATVSASASATTTLGRNPAIWLAKTPATPYVANPTVGSSVGYSYAVTNTGNVTLTGLALTDNRVTGSITLGATTLAPGASTTGTASSTLTQADIDAGYITNTATVTGTAPAGTSPATVSASASATVDLGRNPAINVIKTASPSSLTSPVAGQTLSYAYKVTNTGNVTLTSVTLLDDKTGSVALAAATLSPGASTTGSSSYILTQADIDAGSVINTALVTGTPPAGPNVTAAATATVTLGRNPAISLTKSLAANADQDGSGDVSAGDVLTFQFTATNAGNVTLSTVTITDPLPGMVLSACSASSLAPGASLACTGTYMVTADDVQAGQVVNVATASGTPPPGSGPDVTGTDSETVPVKKAALSLTKTAVVTQVTQTLVNNATVSGSNAAAATYSTSNTVAVSSRITYTLTVSNTGNGNAVNVVLTDTMPAGVVIVANPDGGTVTGNSVTWALGAVAAGASTSVTITVEVA